MKKFLINLIFVLFAFVSCKAQNKILPGEMKGRSEVFTVQKSKQIFLSETKDIIISKKINQNNKGNNYFKDPQVLPMNPKDIHIDFLVIKSIVDSVLHKKLAVLKSNKEKLLMDMIFDTNGKIVDVWFALNENTLISPLEMEEIDKKLRSNLKATFTGQQYLKYNAIPGNRIPIIYF